VTPTAPRSAAPTPRVSPAPRYDASPSPTPRVAPPPRGGSSATDRYAAPPSSVRIPAAGGGEPPTPAVPAAPDYRARLRDLYARRERTTQATPDLVETRGDAVSRTLTPRYDQRLRDDIRSADPEPRPAPGLRSGGAGIAPAPAEGREPRLGPAPSPSPKPTPAPRLAPREPRAPAISDRYPVPGREPRLTPVRPEPQPRTGPPSAEPLPGAGGGDRTTRLRPRVTPLAPPEVSGGSRGGRDGRGGGGGDTGRGGGSDPTLRGGGRSGGLGPRFPASGYDARYANWTVAGSHRYLYGCYHWTGHYAAFWPSSCNWGWYSFPFRHCGFWHDYWFDCRSSFVVYWNSARPAAARIAWWWPARCYMPGSWFGFYAFPSWSSTYVDWGYSPGSGSSLVAAGDDAGAEAEGEAAPAEESVATPAEKHVKLGDFYFRQGRYEEAAESYVRALAYVPDDGALHFVLADALFAQGDYHYAAYMIGKGLGLDPGLAQAEADKREFYDDPKAFDAQLATLRTYLADKPYDAAAHLVLGYNLRFSGQDAEAMASFRRVTEIDPGNAAAKAFLEAIAAGPAAAGDAVKPAERTDGR
jgi:hypothetical protein